MGNVETSKISLSVPDAAEDAVYASYIMTLAALDAFIASSKPDFKSIRLLRARANADIAELEVMAMRLLLVRREDAERMTAELLHNVRNEIERALNAENETLKITQHAHPLLAKRRAHVRMTDASKRAIERLQQTEDQRFSVARQRSARAARIRHLLQPETIAHSKDEFSQRLRRSQFVAFDMNEHCRQFIPRDSD